jgi:nucleotide-binding universal stress UspA family protein
MKAPNKVIVALDGSNNSLVAVRYVARVFSKKAAVVLFHVNVQVPEALRDMNVNSFPGRSKLTLQDWRELHRGFIKDFLDKARGHLVDAGFSDQKVSYRTQPLTHSVVRDILNESQQDYSVLVLGRTGLGKQNDLLMGSVAAKLVDVVDHIPIVVVGEKPQSNKVLVAFDGSRGSRKSIACAGSLLDPAVCEVMLCHVVRPLNIFSLSSRELFIPKHETSWIETNKRKVVPAIIAAQKRLLEAGFPEEKISSQILTNERSRAAAIVKAAGRGRFGTIVLGRRGITSAKEFTIGRVSRKILHLTFQPALWIVS